MSYVSRKLVISHTCVLFLHGVSKDYSSISKYSDQSGDRILYHFIIEKSVVTISFIWPKPPSIVIQRDLINTTFW